MTELTAKYRLVFGSGMGPEVLADILTMAHFGCTLNWENHGQVAEYNFGMAILAKMGILSPETKNEVIKALMAVSPREKKEAGR